MNPVPGGSPPTYETVGLLVVGIVAFLPVVAGILGIGLWVGGIARTTSATKDETTALRQRVHDLANDLTSFKVQAAKEFVPHSAVEKLEERLLAALEKLSERIDRALQPKAPIPPAS